MSRWLDRMRDASLFPAGLERNSCSPKLLSLNGGQGRNRTADASLFRAALYQLSYLATERESLVKDCCGRRIIAMRKGLRQTTAG